MPILFVEKTKKQKYLIIVLIVIFLITAFILWKGFSSSGKPSEETSSLPLETATSSPEAASSANGPAKPKEVNINFELLKNPFLENLQPIEKISPLGPDVEIGRYNPFLPPLSTTTIFSFPKNLPGK